MHTMITNFLVYVYSASRNILVTFLVALSIFLSTPSFSQDAGNSLPQPEYFDEYYDLSQNRDISSFRKRRVLAGLHIGTANPSQNVDLSKLSLVQIDLENGSKLCIDIVTSDAIYLGIAQYQIEKNYNFGTNIGLSSLYHTELSNHPLSDLLVVAKQATDCFSETNTYFLPVLLDENGDLRVILNLGRRTGFAWLEFENHTTTPRSSCDRVYTTNSTHICDIILSSDSKQSDMLLVEVTNISGEIDIFSYKLQLPSFK